MRLIVGLGNPGREYNKTRHNIGFMCIDKIAEYFKVSFDSNKFNGSYTGFNHNGEKIILLKPGKYMNLSGEVIRDFVNFFKMDIEDVLIICDDLDTKVGTYRLRYKGSSGGHNGLKNIELHLSTKDYVLGKFTKEEQDLINPIIDKMPDIIEDYLKLPFDNVMNKYN